MITDQQVQYYKEEYNGHKLIYARFSNKAFLFRTLTVKEYELIERTYPNEFKKETAICNLACLYPEGYEFQDCEFGVLPSVIAGYIKKASDFESIDDIFNDYYAYKNSSNLFQQCIDLIKAFIGDYTYEEMEDWTWQKLMDMTVRAENIASLQGYEYHIEKSEEVPSEPSIYNPEDINKILEYKINPLVYFKDELDKEEKERTTMVDNPFIIGVQGSNEELLNGFREQKAKGLHRA